MTREQRLHEIRKELAVNERLAKLLIEYSVDHFNVAFRKTYNTNDAAQIIRQSGMAEGVEKFVADITKMPSAAPERPA
jgi:hypothetical protein